MRKVCFISPKSYPLFNSSVTSIFGGAEVQASLLSRELSKYKDYQVHIMTADYGQDYKELYEGITLWNSVNFNQSKFKQWFKFLRTFNRIGADIYVQRTLAYESGIIALLCKIKGAKFCYMVASDPEVDGRHKLYEGLVSRFLACLAFRFADTLLVQNGYQEKKLKKYRNKTYLIRTSYRINRVRSSRRDTILWVGRTDRHLKKPHKFLNLASRFPERDFVLIAPPATGQGDYFKYIRRKAQQVRNLEFIEFVAFHKIDKYFQRALVLVNTSTAEGFPNTFIQAAKNGTPILSLNINPDNILNEHGIGIQCNNRLADLVKNLDMLLEDKEKYRQYANRCYAYAKEYHDIHKNARRLMSVLER